MSWPKDDANSSIEIGKKRIELLKTIALIAAIIVVTVGSSVALNLYTGQKIEENKLAAASGALSAVLPEG